MEWLWLFLGVAGLVLLWLLIIAMDKLVLRLKEHDEARKITVKNINIPHKIQLIKIKL